MCCVSRFSYSVSNVVIWLKREVNLMRVSTQQGTGGDRRASRRTIQVPMSETQSSIEKGACRACFGAIDPRATKCPHCQSYQGLHRVAAISAVMVLCVVLGVLVAGALVLEFGLGRKVFQDDANYADQVTIDATDLFVRPPDDLPEEGNMLSVIGRLTNKSPKELRYIRLRVEVLNDKSQLVDAFDDSVRGPLSPGGTMSFRIDSYRRIHLPESDYKSHKVFVTEATAG